MSIGGVWVWVWGWGWGCGWGCECEWGTDCWGWDCVDGCWGWEGVDCCWGDSSPWIGGWFINWLILDIYSLSFSSFGSWDQKKYFFIRRIKF